MSPTSSSRSCSTTSPNAEGNPYSTEDYLARKRERDRKSQRAMRDRTQRKIRELQAQVAYLVDRGATMEALLQAPSVENATLKAENRLLTHQLEKLRFAATTDLPVIAVAGATAFQDQEPQLRSLTPHLEVWEQVPWNTPPTCVSDNILYGYIATQRSKMNEPSPRFPDVEPDFSRLLLPAIVCHPKSLSTVISDIILSYKDVNTLPMKMGAQHLIFKVLNWIMFRTQETYNQMPPWLRPLPLQLQVQHPAWIDRVPWPEARIFLIKNPQITFADYISGRDSSFDISWPYEHSHVVTVIKSVISVNPVFDMHMGQLKNWEAGEEVRRMYPEVGRIVDKARAGNI